MGTSILLSGLIGALVASALAVFYQYVSLMSSRRFEVMLLAVDYLDEINYLTRHIEGYKAKKYIDKREVMTPDDYRSHCNKLNALVTSSRVHARVALVYGENSATLDKFNQLRAKMTDATLRLFRATEGDWLQASAEIHDAFEKEIDPLRHATNLSYCGAPDSRQCCWTRWAWVGHASRLTRSWCARAMSVVPYQTDCAGPPHSTTLRM